jgi:membrane fusion protein (multidrug efflux system)
MNDKGRFDAGSPTYRRWAMVAGGLALILAIAFYFGFHRIDDGASSAVSNPPSQQTAHDETTNVKTHPVDVQVMRPIRRTVLYRITLPANIAPLYQTTLYAKVSGYLKWIGPDKGDTVKAHEVLAVIDAPEVEEQYHQAVADYKIKKLTYERLAKVWKESPDVIAKQDVDVAEAAYQGARHSMEQREALRGYTKVRAPYDGIVTARFADPGALIQVATTSATGAIPLFTVMDDHTVRVYTNVPQDEAVWIVPGQTKAAVMLKEPAGRRLESTVTRSTLALDPSTRRNRFAQSGSPAPSRHIC